MNAEGKKKQNEKKKKVHAATNAEDWHLDPAKEKVVGGHARPQPLEVTHRKKRKGACTPSFFYKKRKRSHQ